MLYFTFRQPGVDDADARESKETRRESSAPMTQLAVYEWLVPSRMIPGSTASAQAFLTLQPEDRPRRKIVWDPGPVH